MEKKEFNYTFQITKTVIFEVSYKTVGNNKSPYFTTSAAVFNRPKSDFNRCGQCQKDVLTGHQVNFFFMKWDCFHLLDLTSEQYQLLSEDIEQLKDVYNWINNQSFGSQRELSKMKLKA